MLYVSGTNGNDANNCSSQFPCMSLKGALNASYEYYNNSQNLFITFSEGIYSGKDNINITLPENYNITISSNSDETSTIFQCDSTYSYGFKASEINVFSVNKITIEECHLGIDHQGINEFQININQAIFSKNAYSIHSQARNVKISNSQFIDGNITHSGQYSVYLESINIQIESTTFKNVAYLYTKGQTNITDCVFDTLENSYENIFQSGNITIQNSFFNSSLVGTCIEMYETFSVISIQNSTLLNCGYPISSSSQSSQVGINIFDSTLKNVSRFTLQQSSQLVNSVFVGSIDNYYAQLSSYLADDILIENCAFSYFSIDVGANIGIIKNSDFTQLSGGAHGFELSGNWIVDSNYIHDVNAIKNEFNGDIIYVNDGDFVFTNCTFKNIITEGLGFSFSGRNVVFSKCNFSNITSYSQSNLIVIEANGILNISNSNFEYITAYNTIYLSAEDANIYISDCIFYNIDGYNSPLYLYTYRSIFIDNCVFSQNINNRTSGGAIEAGGFSYFYVQNSQFSRNMAFSAGGAISLTNKYNDYTIQGISQVQILSTSFTDNTADRGPVLYCETDNFEVYFSSSTMDGNAAKYGGDVDCFSERNTTAIWIGVSFSVAVVVVVIVCAAIYIIKKRKQNQGFHSIN